MRSLRARVAVGVLTGHLVLLGTGSLAAYRAGERVLEKQFDESLAAKVATFESLVEQEGEFVAIERVDGLLPEYERKEDPEYFEVLWRDAVIARSPSLGGAALLDPAEAAEAAEAERVWDAPLPDGRPGRFAVLELVVRDAEPAEGSERMPEPARLALVLAHDRGALDRLVGLLLGGIVGGAGLLALAGMGLTWLVVGLVLRPLRRFGERVAALDERTLVQPLDDGSHPREMAPVVNALEGLLSRLDSALRAERRTASNGAHELRTPLSELRTLTEVALQEESTPEYRSRALREAREIALQMDRLVTAIRSLTAIDAGSTELIREEVPLKPLLERICRAHERCLTARRLAVEVDVNGEVAHCDRDALFSVCNNLFANAAAYAPEGTRVRLRVSSDGGLVTLRVDNECDELAEADLERLAEPFWRRSHARTETDHHGLGLTIAQGMAQLGGILLEFSLEQGRFVADVRTPSTAGLPPRSLRDD